MTTPQNRQKQDGKFQKGRSGNPGGRPKEVAEVRDLARQHTTEAIKTLVSIMKNPKQAGRSRAAAAEAILNRGWGKPMQPNEHSGPGGEAIPIERIERIIVDPANPDSPGVRAAVKAGPV